MNGPYTFQMSYMERQRYMARRIRIRNVLFTVYWAVIVVLMAI